MDNENLISVSKIVFKPLVKTMLMTQAMFDHYAENIALIRQCDKSVILEELNSIMKNLNPQIVADFEQLIANSFKAESEAK